MQALRSMSVRRLGLCLTASVARRPQNPLLSVLSCRPQSFSSSPARWYSSTDRLYQQTTEESEEGESGGVEENDSTSPGVRSPSNTLFIGNIPYSTTDQDLLEAFSVYGPVFRAVAAKGRDGRPMGCAHVGFESRQDAIKVTEAHNESPIVIGDREVRVDYARPWKNKYPVSPQRAVKDRHEPSSTIFVGNIPYHATREDICEALKPLGEVVDIRIAFRKNGIHGGYGHVDFTSTSEAEKVLKHYQYNPIRILDQEVRMDRASPPGNAYPPSSRLYFTKWEGDASSLRSHFRALRSKIVDVSIFNNSDPNAHTGSGFIEFRDLEAANEALVRFNTPELALAYARSRGRSRSRFGPREDEKPTRFGLRLEEGRDDYKRER